MVSYGQHIPDYPGQQPWQDRAYQQFLMQQQQHQQQYQPAPQMSPTQMSGTNPKIWVKSDREALEFHVNANGAADLWNDNAPFVYLKTADASGRQNTRKYRLTEEPIGDNPGYSEAAQPQGIDLSSYAAKTDLATLCETVDGIRSDIEKMKDELANLAASAVKRAVGAKAKREDEENE